MMSALAKKLRQQQTPHEQKLWRVLRAHRFYDFKFRRQFPIGPYIVDFCSPRQRLIIELDGSGHAAANQMDHDRRRDEYFGRLGFRLVRVWNRDIDANLDGAADEIYHTLTG